jgi:membrane associated rhomboid family serine protease
MDSTETTPEQETEAAPVCYRHPKRETWVSCQRCGRPICPECQTQAAVGVQCPECIREGQAGMPRRAPAIVRALRPSGTPVVTYVLIGLCVVLYGLQFLTSGALTDAWLMDPSAVRSEPWRLLTSGFLHSQAIVVPIHLLFNMYALYVFGPALEVFLGRARFLALYLISTIGGSVAEVLLYQWAIATDGEIIEATNGFIQPGLSLGASGAIFGLMGALVVLRKAMGFRLGQILLVVVLNLAIGFIVPNIAWEAHLGGFGIGAAIAAVYLRTRRSESKALQIVGVAGIAVGLALIVAVCVATAPTFYR